MAKFRHIIITLLLLLLTTLSVNAAEAGLPENAAVDGAGLIWLTDSMAYDTLARDFAYPVADSGVYVHSSAADGMIISGSVKLSGGTLLIYRNGQEVTGTLYAVTDPGEYVVMAQYGNQTPRLFTFTIVKEATNKVYAYNLPTGMLMTSATRDGNAIAFDRYSVPMEEDGLYHVEYECLATNVHYSLDITIDRTPPDVHFSGAIDENNRVHSALSFSGLKRTDSLRATLNGTEIEVSVANDGTGQLLESGNYVITAFDAAGNRSEYAYTVLVYLNTSSLLFVVVLCGSVAALVFYVLWKRKNLRIG